MSSNLTPTARATSCPICEDHSGKCRVSRDENLVLCLSSAGDDWQVSGYKAIGDTKCGTWQQYRRAEDRYDPAIARRRRDEWQARERDRIAALPSLASRHTAIAGKLQRGLSAEHRAALVARGLSEAAIERYGFYSLSFGIAGAVRGVAGGYVAEAYRLDNPESGGRYRWGKNSQLPGSGELPIAIYQPAEAEAGVLYLCEGSIIKPAIAAERMQATTIGYGGGSGDLSRIAEQLRSFCSEFSPSEIRILPDAGYRANAGVSRAIDSLIEICKPIAPVAIGDWNQAGDKAAGDIDEISIEQIERIEWLPAAEATAPVAPAGTGFAAPAAPKLRSQRQQDEIAKIDRQVEALIAMEKRIDALTKSQYIVDLDLDSDFLPADLYQQIPRKGVVGICSRKSSGKSKAVLKPIIAEFQAAGKSIFSAHSRLSLVFEQCKKFDLLTPKEAEARRREIDLAVAACIDSFLKFSGRHYDLIVLDEIRALLAHMCRSSTTVARYRGKIYDALRETIAETVRAGGLVLAADADFGAIEYDFLKEASGVKPFMVHNRAIGERRKAYIYSGSWDGLVDRAIVDVRAGKRLAIVSDSQGKLERIAKKIGRAIPGIAPKVVRVDRKTSTEDEIRELLTQPDEKIAERDVYVLLWSPSMSVGVSIEQRHFDAIYGFYGGVIAPAAFRQQAARYRPNVPLHLWIDSKQPKLDYGGSTDADEIANSIATKPKANDLLLENAIAAAKDECEKFGELASRDRFLDAFARAIDPANPLTVLTAKLIARDNAERKDYRSQLLLELQHKENFELIYVEADRPTALKAELKAIGEEIEAAEAEAMAAGAADESITEDEVHAALREGNLKHAEALKMQGRKLHFDLPGVELDAEGIAKLTRNRGQLYSALKLRAMMAVPEYAEARDRKTLQIALTKSLRGIAAANDVRLYVEKIEFLEHSGIDELGRSGREFDAEAIEPIANYCDRREADIKRLFGVEWSRGNPIRCLKSLLARLGYDARQSRREKNHRFYQCIAPSEFEAAAAAAIEKRYRDRLDPPAPAEAAAATTRAEVAIEPDRVEPAPAEVGAAPVAIAPPTSVAPAPAEVAAPVEIEPVAPAPAPAPKPIAAWAAHVARPIGETFRTCFDYLREAELNPLPLT